MFMAVFIVVTVSWLYTYFQTHPGKHVQLFWYIKHTQLKKFFFKLIYLFLYF